MNENKTKRVLLVGCGAEIGSMLVGMVNPDRDGMEIAAILTRDIDGDPKYPELQAIDSLSARVVLAQPQLIDDVSVDRNADHLIVRGNPIPVFWGDIEDFDLNQLPKPFDAAVVATSKRHIGDTGLMSRIRAVADLVVGVAEGDDLPAVYPCLIGAPDAFMANKPHPPSAERIYCLGSCQTNGWQAQLRAILEMASDYSFEELSFRAMEVDIVHPDTPTGRLGTKSVSAREQDPRNNLRPSFSQVAQSMDRLYPDSTNVNTISLRTLVTPPGYQICRFYFSYQIQDGRRLDEGMIVASFSETAKKHPHILKLADLPLGSRGFEFAEAAAVVLPQSTLLRFNDDPFGMGEDSCPPVSEMILQSYVHNTRGYCRSVIEAVGHLMTEPDCPVFPVRRA